MKQMTLNETAAWLRDHDDYLILTHIRPDGDTIGSAAALCSALRRCGKAAALYVNPGITERYAAFAAPFLAAEGPSLATVVSVDIAGEGLFPEGFSGNVDLAIDHHPSNSGFAALTLLEAERAACGETILELIKLLCGEITKEEADLLYIAISTDTGCFQYANVTEHTFLSAAELTRAGADTAHLSSRLFRTFSKARLALEGYIYSTLRSYHDNAVNIAIVTREMMERSGAGEDEMDDIASLAGRVAGHQVSVTIKETEDGASKVSVRSNEFVNASDICAHFGGGGHARAAGCAIDCPPEEAAAKLLPLIEAALGYSCDDSHE